MLVVANVENFRVFAVKFQWPLSEPMHGCGENL